MEEIPFILAGRIIYQQCIIISPPNFPMDEVSFFGNHKMNINEKINYKGWR
jgi:hypothetical protein